MIHVGPLVTAMGWIRNIRGWIKGRSEAERPDIRIPRKSLILLDSPYNSSAVLWSMGRISDRPAMQVMGRIRATNKTKYMIHPTVKWKKPVQFAHVSVHSIDIRAHGDSIPAGTTVELTFNFAIEPPVTEAGNVFSTKIAIEDQFSNIHWTKKKIDFPYKGPLRLED